MLAEVLETAPIKVPDLPADLVELAPRERALLCPTGLHDFCTVEARHFVVPESGLSG